METIELATNKVYHESNIEVPPFPKDTFRQLLKLATTGIFSFNDKLYQQTDGLSMGSPLAPTLANLFVGELENKFFSNGLGHATFYKRYVDDSLLVFESDKYQDFHKFLNSWHPNLKFTVEMGGKQIPFLDIQLNIDNDTGTLDTSVYRKPTFTSLMLNYAANCPLQWKRGLVNTLVNRAYTVCNSWQAFHNELLKLKTMFGQNGYLVWFVDKVICRHMHNKHEPSSNTQTKNEFISCIKIPYFGMQSVYFKKNLYSLLKRVQYHGDFSLVYVVPKLKRFLSVKDKVPRPLKYVM